MNLCKDCNHVELAYWKSNPNHLDKDRCKCLHKAVSKVSPVTGEELPQYCITVRDSFCKDGILFG